MRILHLADLHWNSQHLFTRCLPSSKQIEEIAKEQKPDLIFIAGDVQDKLLTVENETAYAPMMQHIKNLADIAPLVIIYGNEQHDAVGSLEPIRLLDTKYPIHLSEYPETIYLENGTGILEFYNTASEIPEFRESTIATIHCLPYPTKEYLLREKQETQQIDNLNQIALQHLRNIFIGFRAKNIEGIPTIFIGHCNTTGAKASSGQTVSTIAKDIFISQSDFDLVGADYYGLGHIHLKQMLLTKGGYGGSTYHCNFGETEKKYVHIVEVKAGENPIITPIELTATHPMVKHECKIEDGKIIPTDTEGSWDNVGLIKNDWHNAELRVRVTLTEEQKKTFTEEKVKEFYSGAFSYKIEPETIYIEKTRSENISKAENLSEQFTEWTKATGKQDRLTPEVSEELTSIETEFKSRGN